MRNLLCLMVILGGLFFMWHLDSVDARSASATNLSNSSDDSRNPTLSIAADGTRHIVWEEREQAGLTYLWHRTFDGISWSPVVTVASGTRPALAPGPGGLAHLVWTDEFSGTLQVFYSQWTGAAWSAPKLVAPGLSGDAAAPSVVVGADNIVRAAWGEFQNTGFKVYYAQSGNGGSDAWLYAPVPSAMGTSPAVALDASMRVHVVWEQAIGGARDILYSSFDGSAWSTPENVSQSAANESRLPGIALTADGRPLVAWSEQIGAQYDVLSSLRGASWSAPINVSKSVTDSLRPRLANTNPIFFLAWNEAGTPAGVSFAFGGSSWTNALVLASGAGDWSDPSLAVSAEGSLHFAYDGGPDAAGDIFNGSLSLSHTFLPALSR